MLSTFLAIMNKAKPFIKWAGGKTQLIKKLGNYFPDFEGTYYEPFIGGGAVFFHLKPEKAVLGDTNEELINLFKIIKNKPKELIEKLDQHQPNVKDKEYYLDVRSWDIQELDDKTAKALDLDTRDGALITDVVSGSPAEKAGIQEGDIIVSFNNQLITDPSNLKNVVSLSKTNKKSKAKIIRNGNYKNIEDYIKTIS